MAYNNSDKKVREHNDVWIYISAVFRHMKSIQKRSGNSHKLRSCSQFDGTRVA